MPEVIGLFGRGAGKEVTQIGDAIKTATVLVNGVRDADLVTVAHEAAEAGVEWAVLDDAVFVDEVRRRHPSRANLTTARLARGHLPPLRGTQEGACSAA